MKVDVMLSGIMRSTADTCLAAFISCSGRNVYQACVQPLAAAGSGASMSDGDGRL